MPDLLPAERFIHQMNSLERNYLRDALDGYREFRRTMGDALTNYGLDSTAFNVTLQQEIAFLDGNLGKITRNYQFLTQERAEGFMARQLGIARRYRPEIPAFEALAAATQGAARDRMAQIGMEQWTLSLRAQYLNEITRLRAAGEDESVAAKRLFAIKVVDGRASAWRLGRNNLQLATQQNLWSSGNAVMDVMYKAASEAGDQQFQRQAIAAIDERTTDCCLRVHGQIVGLDEAFTLTGTPRFSDRIKSPPFHWYCRTVDALYIPEFEETGVPTKTMRRAANDEVTARKETGKREEIHPAHATSRR